MLPRMIQSNPEGHYAVDQDVDGQVIIQINDGHNQVRVRLNNREAEMLVELIEGIIFEQNEDEQFEPKRNAHSGRCQDCGLFPNNCECD
jgi:hypothetical protein